MDEIDSVIAGLTEAKREWIAAMPDIPISLSPEQWDAMPDELWVDTPDGRMWFGSSKASYHGDGGPWMLSAELNEPGLSVRARLQERADG